MSRKRIAPLRRLSVMGLSEQSLLYLAERLHVVCALFATAIREVAGSERFSGFRVQSLTALQTIHHLWDYDTHCTSSKDEAD
ncbi:hypothetical protein DL93DRAFT_2092310 [Clavulina sp. PMI_390]|nr:hypothetical protein DL93DRAFT_2092310 [Clavulina sp. PMI_390]